MIPQITLYFAPPVGTAPAIVAAINAAATSILVQAYSFTSSTIAAALVAAFRRGLSVQIILDRACLRGSYCEFTYFTNMGLTPLLDYAHAIAHNKVMIIDSALVITGSYNFTSAAELRNAENCLFIADPDVAASYAANWAIHAAHSVPGPVVGNSPPILPSLTPGLAFGALTPEQHSFSDIGAARGLVIHSQATAAAPDSP